MKVAQKEEADATAEEAMKEGGKECTMKDERCILQFAPQMTAA